jgi:hypothetical protein
MEIIFIRTRTVSGLRGRGCGGRCVRAPAAGDALGGRLFPILREQ